MTKSYKGPIRSVKGPSYNYPMKEKKEKLQINDKVYLVYKYREDQKIMHARIYPCKVKTFENKQGEILPVLVEIGTKRELDPRLHHMSKDPEVAIKYLKTLIEKPCSQKKK